MTVGVRGISPLRRMLRLRAFRPVTSLVKRYVDEKIRAVTGLVPNTQFAEDDVFIVGYMKSGNNWFRTLVAGVIYGADPESTPHSVILDLVPNHGPRKPYYKRYSTPMFFKSHYFPRPEYKRVIYLLRDGRDVMVSYLHHVSALQNREIDFLRLVQGDEGLPGQWHAHVETWLSNPFQAQMIVIKYEDLKNDPVNELRRFCAFVGAERDDAFLELMVQKASFEKMQQKEARSGLSMRDWPRDKFFVRRGQVGSYKDEMPPEVLEVFLREAGGTLRKLGYL